MRKYLRKFQKSTMRNSVNRHENTAPGIPLFEQLNTEQLLNDLNLKFGTKKSILTKLQASEKIMFCVF